MTINAKYVHVNLVAKNWKELALFYQNIFGCTPILPGRDLSGQWIEDCTSIPDVHIQGIHLQLPGYGDNGPTLEIFEYNHRADVDKKLVNTPGFAHIAFAVDDIEAAEKAILNAGGDYYGQRVNTTVVGVGHITVVYMTDPEGNIVELQRWSQ